MLVLEAVSIKRHKAHRAPLVRSTRVCGRISLAPEAHWSIVGTKQVHEPFQQSWTGSLRWCKLNTCSSTTIQSVTPLRRIVHTNVLDPSQSISVWLHIAVSLRRCER